MMITYFGYGSLVNASTVPEAAELVPGRLKGWVREWRVCSVWENGQGRCALSVRQDPDAEIWGVMTREQKTRLDALEKRESRYEKIGRIAGSFRCEAEQKPGPEDLFLFKATPENERWGCAQHPILQSYLDCVLAGYHQIWGEEGVEHFFDTTDGWHVPVLPDRRKPLYPRAVDIEPALLRLFDDRAGMRDIRLLTV
ncbi:gamma-glutamylcyclotransferase family protein [Roseibium sp.]|uniref:gamma-glutamylcyclotransferase family protein n=1 Tax=Roseibium sp. TaxID=1936156 RepID=UPI003B52BC75